MLLTLRKKGARSGSVITEGVRGKLSVWSGWLQQMTAQFLGTLSSACSSCLIWTPPSFVLYISTLKPFMAIPSSEKISNLSQKAPALEAKVLINEHGFWEVHVGRGIDLCKIHCWPMIARDVCHHVTCFLILLWVEFGLSQFKRTEYA